MKPEVLALVNSWTSYANAMGPQTERVSRCFLDGSEVGNNSNNGLHLWSGLRKGVDSVARLLTVPSEQILFAPNTTLLISRLVESELFANGGDVVCPNSEHPVIRRELQRICSRHHAKYYEAHCLDDDLGFNIERFRSSIRNLPNSSHLVVVLSHVLWSTGEVVDLVSASQAIQDSGPAMTLIVDGAHALGQLSLADVPWQSIAAYVSSGHKWVRGPIALGIAAIPLGEIRQRYLDFFAAEYAAWPHGLLEKNGMRRDGTCVPNASTPVEKVVGTCAAANVINTVGLRKIEDCVSNHRDEIISALLQRSHWIVINDDRRRYSGILAIRCAEKGLYPKSSALTSILASQFKVIVGSYGHPDTIRISIGYDASPTEVVALLSALDEVTAF